MVKNQLKLNAMSGTRKRAKYTLEFKMEAVRLVKGGQGYRSRPKYWALPRQA